MLLQHTVAIAEKPMLGAVFCHRILTPAFQLSQEKKGKKLTLETKEKSSTEACALYSFFTALCSLASNCTTGTGVCQAIVPYSFRSLYHDFQGKYKFTRHGILKKKEKKKAATSTNLIALSLTDFKILQCFCSESIAGLINVGLSSALSECSTAAQ